MKPRRAAAGALTAVALLVVAAAPAWAHVSIDPSEAPKGSSVDLKFRVPNEMDNANTVKFDVKFPTDHPIASVDVEPIAGWTYQVTTEKLPQPITTDDGTVTDAVSEIVWSGGTIKPGEFQEFVVSAGPLPTNVDSLKFPAIQSYDNGQDVSWIQDTVEGQPEPDHPAPVLKLTGTASSDNSSSSSAPASSTAGNAGGSATGQPSTVVKKETDNTLAIVAIVIGALALIAAIGALARGRSART